MRKMLVVEDDPSVQSLVRALIEAEGYITDAESTIQGGWMQLMNEWQAPDAVIVDVVLRDGEGWDLIERMREDERFAQTPVVVLSGLPEHEIAPNAIKLGCEFVGKPFSAQVLMDSLQRAMRRVDRSLGVRAVQVTLLLDSYRIEGTVFVSATAKRFSDAWETTQLDQRSFLPITDATIYDTNGKKVAAAEFMEIRKIDIRATIPVPEVQRREAKSKTGTIKVGVGDAH